MNSPTALSLMTKDVDEKPADTRQLQRGRNPTPEMAQQYELHPLRVDILVVTSALGLKRAGKSKMCCVTDYPLLVFSQTKSKRQGSSSAHAQGLLSRSPTPLWGLHKFTPFGYVIIECVPHPLCTWWGALSSQHLVPMT